MTFLYTPSLLPKNYPFLNETDSVILILIAPVPRTIGEEGKRRKRGRRQEREKEDIEKLEKKLI